MKLQASIVHEMNRKNKVEIKKGCIKMERQILNKELKHSKKKIEVLRFENIELAMKNVNLEKENKILKERIKMLDMMLN